MNIVPLVIGVVEAMNKQNDDLLDAQPVRLFSYSLQEEDMDDYMKAYDKTVKDSEWFDEYLQDLICYPDFKAFMMEFLLHMKNGVGYSSDNEKLQRIAERARKDYASKMEDHV